MVVSATKNNAQSILPLFGTNFEEQHSGYSCGSMTQETIGKKNDFGFLYQRQDAIINPRQTKTRHNQPQT